MPHFLCTTCGTQFAATPHEPDACPICRDERQYIGPGGQRWTTLDELRAAHANAFAEEEPNLHSIHPRPKAGIGQRAFLVRTPQGNVLWDCVPLLDEATIREVKNFGGLAAIAVSHPHYYPCADSFGTLQFVAASRSKPCETSRFPFRSVDESLAW